MSPEMRGVFIELTNGEESANKIMALFEKHGILTRYLPGENPTETNFVVCDEDLTPEIKNQLAQMKKDVFYIWDDEGTKVFVEKAGFPLFRNSGLVGPFKKLNLP